MNEFQTTHSPQAEVEKKAMCEWSIIASQMVYEQERLGETGRTDRQTRDGKTRTRTSGCRSSARRGGKERQLRIERIERMRKTMVFAIVTFGMVSYRTT